MDQYLRYTQGQEFYSGLHNEDTGADVSLTDGTWNIRFTTPSGIKINRAATIKSIGLIEGTLNSTPQIYWKNESVDFLDEVGHWTWTVTGEKDNEQIGSGQRDSFWVV